MTNSNADLPPQTAMMLTEQEWNDLAEVASHYRYVTKWVEREQKTIQPTFEEHVDKLRRHRELCQRIIDAND